MLPWTDQLRRGFDDIAHIAATIEPTKRHTVSVIGLFYNPLGFLSPIMIRFKMLLQELCKEKRDWDQLLSGELLQKWNKLISELQCSSTLTLPRCIWDGIPTDMSSCSLHGFCDASKHVYAAVIIRTKLENNSCKIGLQRSEDSFPITVGDTVQEQTIQQICNLVASSWMVKECGGVVDAFQM